MLDLTPWTGRLVITELDLVVSVTVALTWWTCFERGQPSVFPRSKQVHHVLLALSTLFSAMVAAHSLMPSLGETDLAYFLPVNAFRGTKGFLLALLLVPCFSWVLRKEPEVSPALFARGMQIGVLGLGVTALWERGLFTAISSGSVRSSLQSLLDFGGTYRITGMFSGMHTGGEAIDGYLVIALPFTLYTMVKARSYLGRFSALMVVGLGVYTLAVTYTRATYVAFAVSAVCMGLLSAYVIRDGISRSWPGPIRLIRGLAVATVILFLVRVWGGYQALFGCVVLVSVAFWARKRDARLQKVPTRRLGYRGHVHRGPRDLRRHDRIELPDLECVVRSCVRRCWRAGAGGERICHG